MDNYEVKVYENDDGNTIATIRNRWSKFRIEPCFLEYRGFRLSRFDSRLYIPYFFNNPDFGNKLGISRHETDFSVIADKIIEVINEAKDKIDEYLKEQKLEPKKKEKPAPIFRRFKL